MRRQWIAQTGLSYVTLVAGIEMGGSFDEAPDRAFRALAGFIDGASRSRRQIAVTAPVIQQNTDLEHPEKIAMTAPVVQQTAPARLAAGPSASTSAIPSSNMDTPPTAPAELAHGAVGGDGLGAMLTGFGVTITSRCSTSCLAQLRRDAAVPDAVRTGWPQDVALMPRRRLSSPMRSSGEPSGVPMRTLHNA